MVSHKKKKIIIVVDDEEDIRTSLQEILHHEGYDVVLAVDGDDFLKKVKTVTPDLIIFDIMMPGTPVKEILKHMKDGVKIIYLTVVKTSEAERENLLESGNIVAYINKPFELDKLVKKISEVI